MDTTRSALHFTPNLFVRGDIDGFFGLALDNLIQLLVIAALCGGVLGFPPDLLYGRVLPGAAISILAGNLFYSWQAFRLAQRTGRNDVAAIPYGINTVSLIAYVFLVMLPAKLAATAAGLGVEEAALFAWRAGLVACLGSAIIETAGAFCADWIRRQTPRAALLAALAGIAVSFISLTFFFKTFGTPIVGFTTFIIVLVCYFGRVRFRGGLPGGLVAVVAGTVLAWFTGLVPQDPAIWESARSSIGLRLPVPVMGDIFTALEEGSLLTGISIILPMGIMNVVASLQNIESAEAAGDSYDTRSSLLANGLGSIAAACFGSCFPTTIYIGHPGWKALGARIGYSFLNGIVVTVICLTGSVALIGLVIPIEAGMAIVLWIGIVMVAQAFEATPRNHAPAVAVGLLPGIAGWGVFMLKQGVRAAGSGIPGGAPTGPELEAAITRLDISAHGAFAIEQGSIFTAMIFAATVVAIIDRHFRKAAIWMSVGALLSWLGLLHAYSWANGDTTVNIGLGTGTEWALGYLIAALFLLAVPYITKKTEDPTPPTS
jgi:AGZA family xanthine/uracil permease-like MFS transporter